MKVPSPRFSHASGRADVPQYPLPASAGMELAQHCWGKSAQEPPKFKLQIQHITWSHQNGWCKFEDCTVLIREENLNSFPSRLCRVGNFQQGSSELGYPSFQHHRALVCLCKNYLNWPSPSKLWAVLVSEIHATHGKEYQISPHMCTSLSMRQPQLRQWLNMWQRPRQKRILSSCSMISTMQTHTPLHTGLWGCFPWSQLL